METDSCNGCNVICQCMSVDDHLPILLSRPRSQISKGLGLGLKVKFKSSFTGRIIDNIHIKYCCTKADGALLNIIRSVQFISAQLAATWMTATSDRTVVTDLH